MNKNKLRNIIELVVRKEVKKQLSEIFINEEKEISLAETISQPKPKKVINKFRGDQDYMTARYPGGPIWPRDWVMSYKWEIGLEPGEKKRSPHDLFVKQPYTDRKHGLPEDCAVAVFHGKPNPAEVQHDPLVLENWK